MARSVLVRVSLVRAALLGATALSLFSAPVTIGDAAAKVGVTSATDGDPLGKPPQQAERVLRIGIDVQANELITTNENDRAHLLFLDGSSLTVGPNAQLTIDRFVFDPTTKTGELAINASKGVLRLVGGKISKGSPITITTPSSTIGIRGGITILDVKANQTDSTFVFGKDMTVRGGGQTQVATRPGSMIVTNFGSPPGMPTILAQGALNAQLGALEGRRAPQGGSGGSGSGGRNPDQVAQSSGFSGINSSQSVRIVAPGVPDNFGSGPGPRNRNPNDTPINVVANTNPATLSTVSSSSITPTQQPELPPPPITEHNFNQPTAPRPQGGPPDSKPDTAVTEVTRMTSTATYVGGMLGVVNNRQIVGGTYQNVWNFGTRSGVATMSFDNARFQANTVAGGNSANFGTRGPVQSQNIPNRSIELNGRFVGDGAAFQVGTFHINGGRGYDAKGIFAGEKR
jgi:hypothetical protein